MSETPDNTSYEFNTSLPFESVVTPNYYNSINVESVKKWLKNPMQHNSELRMASRVLYNKNGIYTNVIDYMVALPTLDRVVYGSNKDHSRYKKNKKKYLEALKKMKDREIVRDILFKSALEGTSFYYFESNETEDFDKFHSEHDKEHLEINAKINCSVLPLPTDYCEIIGMKNSSYVVAFDLSYFDGMVSKGMAKKLRRYPKEIREGYKAYKKDLNKRWITLNNDKTIAVKVRAKRDEKWGRPLGLSSFVDMLYDEYFVDTKRNVLDEVNSTVIYETFPEGEKKGQSSLTQKQQEAQHNNIKNALFNKGAIKGINFFSVAAGTKLDKLNTNVDFLKVNAEDEMIKRISTNLGFAGSLLNAESGTFSSQKSNLELITAEIMSWMEQIQEEFNKVINANVIDDRQNYIEVAYLPITYANRKEMVAQMKELYMSAGGSLNAWIASTGFTPETYLALMDEERSEGFDEKYPPHMSSYTTSGKDSRNQKQVDNDSDNPNTQKNKQTGSNPVD